VVVIVGLILIALWLWMARAAGQGKNWARALSTALFGLATLELAGNHGLAQLLLAMVNSRSVPSMVSSPSGPSATTRTDRPDLRRRGGRWSGGAG
jgi:4-amino-4-deoxy-L-arabinose transferase-like glycosyltransferase